jgi:hypothetical protein
MIPVLKTWRELGINMDELSDSTRASMEGQVTDKTFADWLKRKTETDPTFADRTLGKGRAELWKSGKITMDQMISGGNPLSLNDLKAKHNRLTLNNMDIFKEAKSGGTYAGFYDRYKNEYTKRLNKSVKSYEDVIAEHEAWIRNPKLKIGDGHEQKIIEQNIKKWQEDIARNSDYKTIIKGILEDKAL